MADSFRKINQRALTMLDFEPFVNVLILDAGIASMFPICILDISQRLFQINHHQILNTEDKRQSQMKFNFPMTTPGILESWSHAFLPNSRPPWAGFWFSWTGGTAPMP